jgi:transposase
MSENLKMRKTITYTPEFRREAASQVILNGRTTADVSKSLGVIESTLSTWVSKFRSQECDLKSSQNSNKNQKQKTEEQLKIAELEAKLRRVTQERDILKKATAFFAQYQG